MHAKPVVASFITEIVFRHRDRIVPLLTRLYLYSRFCSVQCQFSSLLEVWLVLVFLLIFSFVFS